MSQPYSSASQNSAAQDWIDRSIGDGDRYHIDQRLGGGGMGEVFIATDTRLGKPIALKLLKESLAIATDLDLRSRFERECSICAALKSQHIVQVTDYGVTAEGYPFYVMEYLQGQTLSELLASQPQLSMERACNIIIQACDGLSLAHAGVILRSPESSAGEQIKVVHRDLKPANILLIPTALGELVKIIDFGIAKIRSLNQEYSNATGMFLGTFHYAPPEQFNLAGEVDERADIYSLGMMLYEMLTGVDPFGLEAHRQRVTNETWLNAHVRKIPMSLRSHPNCEQISPALEAIVMRCLEKQPGDRFSSVTELSQALQAILTGNPTTFPKPIARVNDAAATQIRAFPRATVQRPGLFQGLLLGTGALVAIAIATVAAPQLFSRFAPSPTPVITSPTAASAFTLDTHQMVLSKTLSDRPQQAQPIWAALISPDQRQLISGGEDRDPFNDQFFPVKVWNLSTGEVPNTFNEGHTAPIHALSLSPDGRILASGSLDKTVKLWDLTTGKLLHTLTGHQAPVTSVALSQDGRTLVSGSGDRSIKIWDVETGQLRHTLTEHIDEVTSVALSPDSKILASGSKDMTIKLWNAESGELIRTLGQPEGHLQPISAIAISPDGQQLASGSWEQNVKLWNLQTGKLLRTFTGHTNKVETVTFVNSQTIASSGEDQTIRLWDTQSEKGQVIAKAHEGGVRSLSTNLETQTLISTSEDKTIKLWQWKQGL
ncbi:MAG: serine/threonine protein kinase [Oculatellaceae cyanobacterium Prado106]|jgi:WD40 repeat protein|nr:serine/threonine protein kinase [Oculatellaceae cyanobacterium Prado106]